MKLYRARIGFYESDGCGELFYIPVGLVVALDEKPKNKDFWEEIKLERNDLSEDSRG